ncbi:MAG: ATP-binding protein [Eubacteriales bacterium]
MKRESKYKHILFALYHYLVFFLLVAFVITCCMSLFVTVLSRSMDLTFTEENLHLAAKLTFGNVLLLSAVFTVIDAVRRYFCVLLPVRRITSAAERIMQGDFSVRITPMRGGYGAETFNPIVECFNEMAEELSGIETLRSDFIANVSHELKTPLAVMQNYSTMLLTPGLSEDQRIAYAGSIADASRRLADLISNILKLNKLENQQIVPGTREYDLSEQLTLCLLQYEHVWEEKEIEIEAEIPDGVRIQADAELLSLVWNNLLSNAFKFTGKGGKVSVELTATEHHAAVRISDTGCGMTPEVGAHIFEKFYQGDPAHATQGNGLGLALVKRVMDIMQGEIGVESALGKGSTFTVKIRRNCHEKDEKDL